VHSAILAAWTFHRRRPATADLGGKHCAVTASAMREFMGTQPTEHETSSRPAQPASGPVRLRIAGIDYGTRRIGIAIADLEVKIASPSDNYTRRGEQADADY